MIPFNRPQSVGRELEYVARAIESGGIGAGGEFTTRCQRWLESEIGTGKALLTTSCTAALEMAALLIDITAGDEVIVPSFTFPSSATAFVLRGAVPVFADIRDDTLNIDETRLEQLVRPGRTRAIVAMHYAGIAAEIDSIAEFAQRHNLVVVEDNAHGLFGRYRSRPLGSFGSLSAQSFHETKNVTCGEGGALFVNDERFVARAEIIRDKGTNRARFFRGEIDKYSWVDVGSSYAPSDVLAALLWAQLECKAEIQARRTRIWNRYAADLADWAAKTGARTPFVPSGAEHPAHLFYLIMDTVESRDALIQHLRKAGVQSAFHYVPLHLSDMGRRFGAKRGDCPVSETLSDRLIRLPFYNHLGETEQERVISAAKSFR